MEHLLSFPKLTGLKKFSSSYGQFGDDYIFANITSWSGMFDNLKGPIRVSGAVMCLVLEGTMTVTLNDMTYEIPPASMLNFNTSSVLQLKSVEGEKINMYVLFIASSFLHDINMDINAINLHSIVEHGAVPVVRNLTTDELAFITGSMDLLYLNAALNDESTYKKNIARSLIQALLYELLLIRASRLRTEPRKTESLSGKVGYVQSFMELVQMHHGTHRNLSFYADKLYITPKYLSRIIKEATGKSAASWIDDFVIVEAKNMLRFSNKNIQQVAYELNFTTQSSFGKFFKHMTGMSPSDYQKT